MAAGVSQLAVLQWAEFARQQMVVQFKRLCGPLVPSWLPRAEHHDSPSLPSRAAFCIPEKASGSEAEGGGGRADVSGMARRQR